MAILSNIGGVLFLFAFNLLIF
ncbi:Protein of unknown function [Bacillus toyonensis]|nr:Protein of unknown function [Bacillus toyonensis]